VIVYNFTDFRTLARMLFEQWGYNEAIARADEMTDDALRLYHIKTHIHFLKGPNHEDHKVLG
jgi:hypothetical protein